MLATPDMARRAKEMLDDDVVRGIISYLEGRYVSEWRNTPPGEFQKREAAYAAVRALEDFKVKLSSLANAPKVDAHNNRNVARR